MPDIELDNKACADITQTAEVSLPMDRSATGEYTGLTLSAVSRAFRSLITRGILEVRNRRHVMIANRPSFEKIAGDPVEPLTVELTSRAH
jgi:hypothetical protein